MASLHFHVRCGMQRRARPPPIRLHLLPTVRTDWLGLAPISMLQQQFPCQLAFQLPPSQRRLACYLSKCRLRMPFPQRTYLVKHLLGPRAHILPSTLPVSLRAPFALLNPFSLSKPFHPQENWDALVQGKRASALSKLAALFAPAQHDSEHRNHFLSALFTKHTIYGLCTKHTNYSPNDAPAVPAFTPRAGASQNGARLRLRPDFRTACRRCEERAGPVCRCKCKQLRAFASAPSRVWSRLVAFSRAIFLFSCPGTFGRVLSYLVISCRILSSFFVISRHSSSQNLFFRVWRATDGCGIGWAGRAVLCCAWFPRRGQDVHHVMIVISNWFATAAGPRLRWFVLRTIVLQNRGVCSSWESRGHLSMGGFWLALKGQDSQQLYGLQFMQLMQFG